MYRRLRLTALIVLFAFVALPLSIDALTAENLPAHDSGCNCFECEIEREASNPETGTDRTIWDSVTNIGEAVGSEFVFGYSTKTAIDEELEAHGVYDRLTSWMSSTADSVSDWFWDSADYYYDAYMDAWGY